MTMTGANQRTISIQEFYARLDSLGLSKKFVQDILLPEWWVQDYEAEPGAVVDAAAYVSRRVNLDFNSLIRVDAQPHFKEMAQPCYKVKTGSDRTELDLIRAIACRVAELVAYTWVGHPYDGSQQDSAQSIRNKILQQHSVINLESLINYCWELGIPVVHVKKFPRKQKKIDGMVGFFSGGRDPDVADRPVIVISKNQKSPAWLAFILAHELGHLINGHVQDALIIDEQVNLSQNEDEQELEADEFALEILFGKKNPGYFQPRNLKAETLANYAQQYSVADRVDAGAIALHYAWYMAKTATTRKSKAASWATAQSALKLLEGEVSAPSLINSCLSQHLDRERLSEDNQEFLERMIGV